MVGDGVQEKEEEEEELFEKSISRGRIMSMSVRTQKAIRNRGKRKEGSVEKRTRRTRRMT